MADVWSGSRGEALAAAVETRRRSPASKHVVRRRRTTPVRWARGRHLVEAWPPGRSASAGVDGSRHHSGVRCVGEPGLTNAPMIALARHDQADARAEAAKAHEINPTADAAVCRGAHPVQRWRVRRGHSVPAGRAEQGAASTVYAACRSCRCCCSWRRARQVERYSKEPILVEERVRSFRPTSRARGRRLRCL